MKNNMTNINQTRGFTLIELMIVVAIIGIVSAIAYPSYQGYVIKSNRTDMMSEMHNIASEIQSRKLAQGAYSNALITGLGGEYPTQSTALYTITFTPNPLAANWTITATPKAAGQMANDGNLSINFQNVKCRGSVCGTGKEWNN